MLSFNHFITYSQHILKLFYVQAITLNLYTWGQIQIYFVLKRRDMGGMYMHKINHRVMVIMYMIEPTRE